MARIKTTPSVILQRLLVKLAPAPPAEQIFAAENVFLTLADDEEITSVLVGDHCITITPRDFPFDQPMAAGGGTNTVGVDGTIEVASRTRLNLDEVGRDGSWLTHATLGALAKWTAVLNLIHMLDLMDASGNQILEQPMRCLRWTVPPRKPRTSWGKIVGTFAASFLYDLSAGT